MHGQQNIITAVVVQCFNTAQCCGLMPVFCSNINSFKVACVVKTYHSSHFGFKFDPILLLLNTDLALLSETSLSAHENRRRRLRRG